MRTWHQRLGVTLGIAAPVAILFGTIPVEARHQKSMDASNVAPALVQLAFDERQPIPADNLNRAAAL